MLNWRQSRCLVASIANAALGCLPAYLISGGHVPPYAFLAIIVAALCEGLAMSPQRIASHSDANGRVMLCNIAHGVAVLICLQTFTVMANTSSLDGGQRGLLGAALLVVGVAMRTTAIHTLGEHFGDGFTPIAARRVTNGPYQFFRHPAELGLLLLVAGYGTLVRGWAVLTIILFAALAVVSTVRVLMEEIAFLGLIDNEPLIRPGRPFFGDRARRLAASGLYRVADIIEASKPIKPHTGNASQ